MAKDSNANWMDIDVETLSADAQTRYAAYKDAQRKAATLRTEFENLVNAQAQLPQGKKLVFGYRFGKLSAALVDDDAKPAKGSSAKQSLADFIAAQEQSGRRA